jgi:hypothetical protein
VLIKKLQDENEEFKDSTTWLKSQDEKLQDSKENAKIWETIGNGTRQCFFIRNNMRLWKVM